MRIPFSQALGFRKGGFEGLVDRLLCTKRAQHDVRALNLKRGLRLHEGREVLQVAQHPGVSQKESHLLAPFEGGRPLLLLEGEEEIH